MAETKEELLANLRRDRAAWETLLAEIGEERMELPGVTPEWTFKDMLVHLTNWWRRRVAVMAEIRRGEEPTPHPPEEHVSIINDWVYYINRDRPLADVLRDARSVWQEMEAAALACPEEVLLEEGRYADFEGEALGPAVVGGFAGHFHEEHEPDIRAWLARLDS
jgi:hypothetical protein